MATQFIEGHSPERGGTEARSLEAGAASSMAETLTAGGALVLSIIGLAGGLPGYMMTVGTIVLGVALLFEAGAVAARYQKLVHAADSRLGQAEVGGGMGVQTITGIAGVVLGILALLNIAPLTLCAVALIAFGGGAILGSAATARFRSLNLEQYGLSDTTRKVLDESVNASAGTEVLVGAGAIVLGILALLGIAPLTLVLVGLLSVSAGLFLAGSAVGARMLSILKLKHHH